MFASGRSVSTIWQTFFAIAKGLLLAVGGVCVVALMAAFVDYVFGGRWGFHAIYIVMGVVAVISTTAGYFVTDYFHALVGRPRQPDHAPDHHA